MVEDLEALAALLQMIAAFAIYGSLLQGERCRNMELDEYLTWRNGQGCHFYRLVVITGW